MDDLFAPPDAAWVRIQPALRRLRRLVLALVAAVLLVLLVVLGALVDPVRLVAWPLAVVVLLVSGWLWWLVGRNVRNWGYAERAEDLWITRGALVRRLVVVPYGRMQLVDVTVGPVERAFGLAAVQLHTASPATNARIPGLAPAEAARLRDRLTELGEAGKSGL
ncbi:MAG: PH domain-containing protein [Marmoricola sp.]